MKKNNVMCNFTQRKPIDLSYTIDEPIIRNHLKWFRVFYFAYIFHLISEIFLDMVKQNFLILLPPKLRNRIIFSKTNKQQKRLLEHPLSSKKYKNLISEAKKFHNQLILSKLQSELKCKS